METNGKATDWLSSAAGQQVQSRLSEERTLQAIDHLLQRIDTLEAAVERLAVVMHQGPGFVSMATDMVDDQVRRAKENGIYLDERMNNALVLAEKLTAPETTEQITKLLEFARQAPGMISMVTNIIDDSMANSIKKGYDPQALFRLAGTANTALAQSIQDPPKKVGGIFSMLRALRDPDRQRGISFLLSFLKNWGSKMKHL
jgi:uncharacterized protein YjgD (DUF1641 family)